ncbi:MAG: hypothetical protein ACMG6E_05310, partial [Candidatus Roizmanbacteria bacterium]
AAGKIHLDSWGLTRVCLDALFNKGYYRTYFGEIMRDKHLPPAQEIERNQDWNFWKLVHQDIWSIMRKLDKPTIERLVEECIRSNHVQIEFNTPRRQSFGMKKLDISFLLPPDIYAQVGDLSYLGERVSVGAPLRRRLRWTARDPKDREKVAQEKLIISTDRIRRVLLPRYHQKGVDVLTQIRLIHRAHMRSNEHFILMESQARRMLSETDANIDKLAGRMRSPKEMDIQISFADGLVLCASYQRTPELMEKLGDKIDELFPLGGKNPLVDEQSIYHYASALQLIVALIHPFYEANGRTSEDSMYILWQRRPDLRHTQRYISSTGRRDSAYVNKRMQLINDYGVALIRMIAESIGISREEALTIKDYQEFLSLAKKQKTMSAQAIEKLYLHAFDTSISLSIDELDYPSVLINDQVISELADHLRNGPKRYRSAPSQ